MQYTLFYLVICPMLPGKRGYIAFGVRPERAVKAVLSSWKTPWVMCAFLFLGNGLRLKCYLCR